MGNETPMWALGYRFNALGVLTVLESPVYMNPKQLATDMFKDFRHHSEVTSMSDLANIMQVRYYVDQLAKYSDVKAGATRQWAEYDSAFWRHYQELLERELNQMPTTQSETRRNEQRERT